MRIFILAVSCLLIIISCKKELKPEQDNNRGEIATVMPPTSNEKEDLYKLLAKFVLKTAKYNVDFKKHVYSECYHETYGDSYVRIQDLIDYNEGNENIFWETQEQQDLQQIVDAIRIEDSEEPYEPILFVPFLEDIIENESLEDLLENCPEDLPAGVIGSQYDDQSRECPAYTLNQSNALIMAGYYIDETYA